MTNQSLEVGADVLPQISKEVAQCRVDLNNIRTTLGADLGPMAEKYFKGQAGSAFAQMVYYWDQKADKVIQTLNQFEAELDTTESKNLAQDAEQGANFSNVQAKLG